MSVKPLLTALLLPALLLSACRREAADAAATTASGITAPAEEVRRIARDAYVYGVPMVDQYRAIHTSSLDPDNPQYRGPLNTLTSYDRVFTPEDTTVVTPNADTPYTLGNLDLRAEPMVLTVPPIDPKRYYVFQLMDLYTFNFDYIGSRATGNGGGHYLIVGPDWQGQPPPGIDKVIRAETQLASLAGRTQLFGPQDMENVKQVQAGYALQPLSTFIGSAAPPDAPKVDWIAPLPARDTRTSPEFFNQLAFLLQFAPVHPFEQHMRDRFAQIGVVPGRGIDLAALSPELRQALVDGMADGQKQIDTRRNAITGRTDQLFGTREELNNDYIARATGAQVGLGGNSRVEAIYRSYEMDAEDELLDARTRRYVIRFDKDQLPPVNAFWSITLYRMPDQLLAENTLDRHLVNSSMLPGLKTDPDGGLTLYVQKDPPPRGLESNWLPAPDGPFMLVARYYWPKKELLDYEWSSPKVERVRATQ